MMPSLRHRRARQLALLLGLLAPATGSHASPLDPGAVVDVWDVPDRERLLVARLYRDENITAVEVQRQFLVLAVSADHFRWYTVRADETSALNSWSSAADDSALGLPPMVVSSQIPEARRAAAHDVAFHIVDRAHRAAPSLPASDEGPHQQRIRVSQRDGMLEASLTGLGSQPLHAALPLGEPWRPDVARLRACLEAGSSYRFCEILRRYELHPRHSYVPTAAPLLWILRAHRRHDGAGDRASYLFVLFSKGRGTFGSDDQLVRWFVARPVDAAEQAQLAGWAAAGGASGPPLSPRLQAEIARQRASAYAGDLTARDRSFVGGFSFSAGDGQSLAARSDGDGAHAHVDFIVSAQPLSLLGDPRPDAVDYVAEMPLGAARAALPSVK